MASVLRSIVAGPRQKHPEAGLDLCYVTDNIVVTSGPSSTYPQRAYRNPTDAVVKWLDSKHGEHWAIWEFRAEGTGYPDSEVYGRVSHYPWPDHHPPPYHLIPNIMASMRNWLHEPAAKGKGRTVVIHCKAGKGRSGTVATSYLISQEGWKVQDALNRFTQRRMRAGFGAGVSIPSQIRWVGYTDKWTQLGKRYINRKVQILEVHVWGLREGVKVSVEGFGENGKKITTAHTFTKKERLIVDGSLQNGSLLADVAGTRNETTAAPMEVLNDKQQQESELLDDKDAAPPQSPEVAGSESGGRAVILRPENPVVLETSDVCIDFERRNRARYGWTMVTSVAHVWFNVFFEGLAEAGEKADPTNPPKDGVFNIAWDAMDGIKGTSRKGVRALDRLAIVWRAMDEEQGVESKVVVEPKLGEPVPDVEPADWEGKHIEELKPTSKNLGLRTESPGSANLSKANSVKSAEAAADGKHEQTESGYESDREGVQTHIPGDQDNEPDNAQFSLDNSGIDKNDGSKIAKAVETARAIVAPKTNNSS